MQPPARKTAIPRSIWALGLVSLFMDTSSELIHSLLPVFLVTGLGASMAMVGLIEGIAEATAMITKIFSGTLSDYFGKRKALTLLGYGMAAITKPLFPLADSIATVMTARFIDRIGKGIRGAPRDALVGDLAPPEIRGACFGLRQSLDTVGAFLGPALAIGCLFYFADNLRSVLWVAVIPAFIAVAVLAFGVQEPEHTTTTKRRQPIRMADVRAISPAFWWICTIAAILTLARFSEAFLILRAQGAGLALTWVPLVLVIMNIVYALSSYPAGLIADKFGRYAPLLSGVVVLIAADLVLALAGSLWGLAVGVALWGLHMGLTQGTLAMMVTDTTPAELRGTAYGVFNLLCGVAMLAASVIAGLLWDSYGAPATFMAGACFTCIALAGLLAMQVKLRPATQSQ